MSKRKRVNLSIDPQTYERLQNLKREFGFGNVCELVVAFVCILLDRTENAGSKKFDLPEDDGRYIDEMFDELGYIQQTLNADTPKNRTFKSLK